MWLNLIVFLLIALSPHSLAASHARILRLHHLIRFALGRECARMEAHR
jgi:hypothetical protein